MSTSWQDPPSDPTQVLRLGSGLGRQRIPLRNHPAALKRSSWAHLKNRGSVERKQSLDTRRLSMSTSEPRLHTAAASPRSRALEDGLTPGYLGTCEMVFTDVHGQRISWFSLQRTWRQPGFCSAVHSIARNRTSAWLQRLVSLSVKAHRICEKTDHCSWGSWESKIYDQSISYVVSASPKPAHLASGWYATRYLTHHTTNYYIRRLRKILPCTRGILLIQARPHTIYGFAHSII